jgi:hypothetical protein
MKKLVERPFISGGKQYGTVGKRLRMMKRRPSSLVSRPSDFDFNKIHTYTELEKRKEIAKKKADPTNFDERTEKMKERYIEGLEFMFNSEADEVIRKLRMIPAEIFYEMYQIYDEFEPTFNPSPQKFYENGVWIDEGAMTSQLHDIEKYLDQYLEGRMEFRLKGF